MSGIVKSTVLKNTPKNLPAPQFGGQNPMLSVTSDGKRLPHGSMCLSPEASNLPPLLWGGGRPMGRHSWRLWRQWEQIHGPRPYNRSLHCSPLCARACPHAARAVELGWTQEQLLTEMQTIV